MSGGGGMNNYTHCTVSASLHSFHLQRETAILDSYGKNNRTHYDNHNKNNNRLFTVVIRKFLNLTVQLHSLKLFWANIKARFCLSPQVGLPVNPI